MKSIVIFVIVMMGVMVPACTHREEPSCMETRTAEEKEDNVGGISFDMESDSLEEEVEEIWFASKHADEEDF